MYIWFFLENISKDGNTKEKALASSFLGLYYYNKKDTINGDKYYKLALNNGFEKYNFYGIRDVFNPKGKDYGVYEFKKGFNGYVEELLGSYTLDIDGTAKVYNVLRKIKKLFKK